MSFEYLVLSSNLLIMGISLLYLGIRYGTISPLFIGNLIFFYYGQCFYIDHLLFGSTDIVNFTTLNVLDPIYLVISTLYCTFSIGFTLSVLVLDKGGGVGGGQVYIYTENIYVQWVMVLVSCMAIVYMASRLGGLNRVSKVALQGSNPVIVFLIAMCGVGWTFMAVKSRYSISGSAWPQRLLLFGLVLNVIFEGGREFFIYMALGYLFTRNRPHFRLYEVLMSVLLLLVLALWKAFTFLYMYRGDFMAFSDVLGGFGFRLTDLDPKNSLLMIADYLRGDNQGFYDSYKYSYVINTGRQFLSALGLDDHLSAGRAITAYFRSYYGGLAYSGILESLLNFGYFGPLLLGASMGAVGSVIQSLKGRDIVHYAIYAIIFIIVAMKLVRTELAVVLKIYLLPMAIAYFLFYRFHHMDRYMVTE